MMDKKREPMTDKTEFHQLIEPYQNHPKILDMKNCKHHGIDRYDHSFRVAYHTYKVTKTLKLNYKSATKAAFLHDFFIDEVKKEKAIGRLQKHPAVAVKNAKEYFGLTEMEESMIQTHMFPVTIKPPKQIEGWILDIIDDIASIYERYVSFKVKVPATANIILMLLITMIK